MCDANRIDRDESNLDEEELAEWNEIRRRIVADICRGQLVVDAEGRPVYTPVGGKSITFNRATGATLIALESHGKGKDLSNLLAAMADMTGTNKGEFSRLGVLDFKACCRLGNFFLADR